MKKSYPCRFVFCALSLLVFGAGNVFSVRAGSAGTNAWNTLALGISGKTPLSFGTATFLISITIVLIDIIFKGKIGFGTLMNATLVAFFSDLLLGLLSFIPDAPNQFVGVIFSLLGQILVSFAGIGYMSVCLGAGPRDTLMIIIGKLFPRAPIGLVKFCLEAAVLLTGVLLGAPFGFGTVLTMAFQATIFQLACRICRFEPRDAVHEDILQSLRNMAGAGR